MDFFHEKKTLRPYQEEATEAVEAAIEAGEKPLLVMATGTGKTVVFAEVVRRGLLRRWRSLVLAHREELIDQAIDKIGRQSGYAPAKEMAQYHAGHNDFVVCGSVQTMQGNRLAGWKRDHFNLITVDEAHHAASPSYRKLIDHFSSASLLGVTATPDRADEKQLGEIFTKVAYEYPLHKAINDGNLVRIIGHRVQDFSIDLSRLKIVAGDFAEGELGELLEQYIAPLAAAVEQKTAGLSTLIFMPSVASSELMAKALGDLGLSSGYISGAMDKSERKQTLYKFSQRQITHLVSCNVLLEGFDEPRTQAIVALRPTGSRALYAQMIGRGTRLYPGKDHVDLIEFTFNSDRLKLVTAYELFSTAGFGERVQARAAAKSKGDGEDFLAILEKTHDEFYRVDKIIERLPIKKFGFVEFDPLALGDLLNVDVTQEFEITYNGRKLEGPATEKQREILHRYNIANVDSLSKAQASVLLDAIFERGFTPMTGLASDSQKNYLRRLGMPIRDENITKAQASMLIQVMKGKA